MAKRTKAPDTPPVAASAPLRPDLPVADLRAFLAQVLAVAHADELSQAKHDAAALLERLG